MSNPRGTVADPERPAVSVLMITKGRRPWLAEALKSIAELDYPSPDTFVHLLSRS